MIENKEAIERATRFKEMRTQLDLSQADLAEIVGVKQQTIVKIEKGDLQRFDPEVLKVLNDKFNIDINWLILGKEGVTSKTPSNCVPIPFYKVGASAGAGTTLYDVPESDKLYFDERWLRDIMGTNPKKLHLITAKGDSMDSGFNAKGDIKDGDLLLVDTSVIEGSGRTFIILMNKSELRVKKIVKKLDGTLILISNNPKYPEEVYRPDEKEVTIEIIGKVVWNGSKENI